MGIGAQRLVSLLVAGAISGAAVANPLPAAEVPAPLKPWTGWVLRGYENAFCPLLGAAAPDDDDRDAFNAAREPGCFWPSRLDLSISATSGRFTQQWQAFRDGWVPLPGNATQWPLDVKVDGRPAPVVASDGAPRVRLTAGTRVVTGTFAWRERPESLQVPPATGLLSLVLDGRAIPQPSRDAEGLLWLQREGGGDEEGENRLDIAVHRRVVDEVPLQLETRVKLDASGRNREVRLGRALPEGFVPMSLDSPLPARLDPDGRLRVQVRQGSWTIALVARRNGPVQAVALADAGGPWAEEELWAFDARPDLRVVVVDGGAPVDPQQTTLPSEWAHLPAWRLRPGETLDLVEQRRGDEDPAPDRLVLARTFWLDFDGRGMGVRDNMSGTLARSWRLNMPAPARLGRVAVDGRDQVITRLSEEGAPGVEVRQGSVQLVADSRLEGDVRTVPAVGWAHDFHSVSGVLELPPGWRLLHVSGVDDAPGTWFRRWSLLDLFLVLVLALATAKLWGWKWGLAALAALGLSLPEADAPRWAWLAVLACEALVRALPEGRAAASFRTVRLAALASLALLLVPFALKQVRTGMNPMLERLHESFAAEAEYQAARQDEERFAKAVQLSMLAEQQANEAQLNAPPQVQQAPAEGSLGGLGLGGGGMGRGGTLSNVFGANSIGTNSALGGLNMKGAGRQYYGKNMYQQKLDLSANDPKAHVQTGPGLPTWSWQRQELRWSGPVDQTQKIRLWLASPLQNLLLALLRVALLAVVFVRLAAGPRSWNGWPFARAAAASAAALLLLVPAPALAGGGDMDIEEPQHNPLLDELRRRLLAPADCHPDCVSAGRLAVEATRGTLRLRQEISAGSPAAVPLPGGLEHWRPERVLVDGQPAKALLVHEGTLHVHVGPGVHQVLLEGALPARDSVQIPLPLKPRRVEARVQGWALSGLDDEGGADDTLQLDRAQLERETGGGPAGSDAPANLPPFVQVERALLLGLDWAVETKVTRLTPAGVPVLLEVPLLEGESVTTAEVRVVAGKAIVNMGPHADEIRWRSVLPARAQLRLAAPRDTAWTETWRLEASPVWHVEPQGLAPVHAAPAPVRIPEWRPWPGEELRLTVSRPAAVPGPTLTVLASELRVTPGVRATDAVLTLHLSSSRGGRHTVKLPAGALLQVLSVNGRPHPERQDGSSVTFPVTPGRQTVRLEWRQPQGISLLFRTPQVDLGLPAVNTTVALEVPRQRWILAAGGLPAGPAVLFWSLLVVLLLVAAGLGRVSLTPLRTREWMLLAAGLTQVPVWAAGFVTLWLLALGWRRNNELHDWPAWKFDALQLGLAGATAGALAVLFKSIERGLLGLPQMQVAGNSSSASLLRWFQDRADGTLPTAWTLTVPLLVYRLVMLAWALWLAVSLVTWLRWGWSAFSAGGLWRRLVPPWRRRAPEARPPPQVSPTP